MLSPIYSIDQSVHGKWLSFVVKKYQIHKNIRRKAVLLSEVLFPCTYTSEIWKFAQDSETCT